jgi:hypothetical protein
MKMYMERGVISPKAALYMGALGAICGMTRCRTIRDGAMNRKMEEIEDDKIRRETAGSAGALF